MKTIVSFFIIAALVVGSAIAWFYLPASSPAPAAATSTAATTTATATATSTTSAAPAPTASSTITAKLGEIVASGDINIVLSNVADDSRCPTDVQCIWAGTVRVEGTLGDAMGTSSQEFVLNQPITTESKTITLIAVSPAKKSTTHLEPSDYRFTFRIEAR